MPTGPNPEAIDRAIDAVADLSRRSGVASATERLNKIVRHPVHPMLTDVPIGCWTSSLLLDLFHTSPKASRFLLGMGVLAAVPTALAGLGDAPSVPTKHRRLLALHIAGNSVALSCFLMSLIRRRNPSAGRLWSAAGAVAMSVGGWAGGTLAFPPSDEAAQP